MIDNTMIQRKIKLNATEDVQELVHAAEKCDFDIDISYQSIVIDAKSFLGVLGLGLSKELTVKYGSEDLKFEDVLDKYTVA